MAFDSTGDDIISLKLQDVGISPSAVTWFNKNSVSSNESIKVELPH